MSRLIDKLKRVARNIPQTIGFRAGNTVSIEPKILLIASLAQAGDIDGLADSVAGADAVLLHLTKAEISARAVQKITDSMPDIPWGAWLEDVGNKKMETLVDSGCDFVVFPASSRVSATPQNDKVGKILQMDASLGDSLLRAVNDLPADAVFTASADKNGPIAWQDLMLFQRLSRLLNKPVLVTAPSDISADELKALWESGVDGVVVEAGAEQAATLKELRRAINDPAFRISRKQSRADATLPRFSMGGAEPEQEEEEEE